MDRLARVTCNHVTPQKTGLKVSCRPYKAFAIGAKASNIIIGTSEVCYSSRNHSLECHSHFAC